MFFSNSIKFKFVSFFVFILFLSFIFVSPFVHNHSDSNFHNNCPACNWFVHAFFILSVGFIFAGLLLTKIKVFDLYSFYFLKPYQKNQNPRSPPENV